MVKKFIKSKSYTQGPSYRTPDHFKGATLARGGNKIHQSKFKTPNLKFNPAKFKTQHKG